MRKKMTAKRMTQDSLKRRVCPYRTLMSLVVLCALVGVNSSFSLPEGGSVESGTAEFLRPSPNTMILNASSDAVVNYDSFSISAQESMIINLPSVNGRILNRDLGGDSSQILGSLTCNGIFILLNESGIRVGPSGQ
ncbi:MAG: filamentous hemagglutinin N-terminal domain-containing protein, partial [Candidatus Omnitrophica bacterium]|nr:filamentous hemagglutinin N-terminal domain-containing protein [Candidatus Omnitrophota bacterium]